MDHSVRGYLERRSTEELKGILQYFQGEKAEEYAAEMAMIQEILTQRKQQREKRHTQET